MGDTVVQQRAAPIGGGSARVIPGKIQLHSVRRSVRLHEEPGAQAWITYGVWRSLGY
jgi:hypothetical protein